MWMVSGGGMTSRIKATLLLNLTMYARLSNFQLYRGEKDLESPSPQEERIVELGLIVFVAGIMGRAKYATTTHTVPRMPIWMRRRSSPVDKFLSKKCAVGSWKRVVMAHIYP